MQQPAQVSVTASSDHVAQAKMLVQQLKESLAVSFADPSCTTCSPILATELDEDFIRQHQPQCPDRHRIVSSF